MSRLVYYHPAARGFRKDVGPGAIAVPGLIFDELMEDQRAGVPMEMSQDGTMPLVVANLLTLNGLRAAVSREVKAERERWNNALVVAGYKVKRQLDILSPNDPQRGSLESVLLGLDNALAFFAGILTLPEVLAVQPGTDEGQGAQALKDVIYGKFLTYAATAPSAVKAALADVI